MYKKIYKAIILLISVMSYVALMSGNVIAEEKKYAYVSVYDYTAVEAKIKGASKTGVILDNYKVEIASTTAQTIINAFTENGIDYYMDNTYGPYVNSINGLGSCKGYAGWMMSYNNDDYSNWGISYITLNDGDKIRFDYSNNADYTTDDIGNGSYGLPIISKISLDGIEVKASKTSDYDENWNPINNYYINYENGFTEKITGDGSYENPFILNIPVNNNTDITNIKPTYTTSLNKNYCITTCIDEAADYTNGVDVTISSLGGKYISHYKIYPVRLNENGVAVSTVSDGEKIKSYVYSNRNAKCYAAFYSNDKSMSSVFVNDIVKGVSLIEMQNINNAAYKTFLWTDTMLALK